jgi:hypothetical protein
LVVIYFFMRFLKSAVLAGLVLASTAFGVSREEVDDMDALLRINSENIHYRGRQIDNQGQVYYNYIGSFWGNGIEISKEGTEITTEGNSTYISPVHKYFDFDNDGQVDVSLTSHKVESRLNPLAYLSSDRRKDTFEDLLRQLWGCEIDTAQFRRSLKFTEDDYLDENGQPEDWFNVFRTNGDNLEATYGGNFEVGAEGLRGRIQGDYDFEFKAMYYGISRKLEKRGLVE